MHASSAFALATILISWAHLSSQELNEDRSITSASMATLESMATLAAGMGTAENATYENCTTATGVHGNCFLRRFCDYGSGGIDFTLYMPRGYVRPCKVGEVCCPFDYQLPVVPTYNHTQTDKDFEFDDDD